jgi:hypothetical protein
MPGFVLTDPGTRGDKLTAREHGGVSTWGSALMGSLVPMQCTRLVLVMRTGGSRVRNGFGPQLEMTRINA